MTPRTERLGGGVCHRCVGHSYLCSATDKPWNDCDCGMCERGPSTMITCPACQGTGLASPTRLVTWQGAK
jgi:hypothetical protein